MKREVIVVGAGLAGLALARELLTRGWTPTVLERSRGVGGRCATRRVDGQPVDHGLPFLHGVGRAFLSELGKVSDVTAIVDWPQVIVGDGAPCRPEAFEGTQHRLVFREGVNRLAKSLARGLDVRLGAEVVGVTHAGGSSDSRDQEWEVRLAVGEVLRSRAVVLALPTPAVRRLLRGMEPLPAAIAAVLPLLELVRVLPCLALIARYPAAAPVPAWEASLPGAGRAIHMILRDSSKRAGAPRHTLVIHARAQFSAAHLDAPEALWTRALLAEAAALHGEWLAGPDMVQAHAWRHARVAPGTELSGPLLLELGGAALGVAGDGLHERGGAEGAFRSGLALAERLDAMSLKHL